MKTVTLLCLVAALSGLAKARPTIVDLMSDISLSNEELNLALQGEAQFLFMRKDLPEGSEDMIELLSRYSDEKDFDEKIDSESDALAQIETHLETSEEEEKIHTYAGKSKEDFLNLLGKSLASFCLKERRGGQEATCEGIDLQANWTKVVQSVYTRLNTLLTHVYRNSMNLMGMVGKMENLFKAYIRSGFSIFYQSCYGKLFVEGLTKSLESFDPILQRMATLASADVLRHQRYPGNEKKKTASVGFISALSEFLRSDSTLEFSPAWTEFGSSLFKHFYQEVKGHWPEKVATDVLLADVHSLVLEVHEGVRSSSLLSSFLEKKWRTENWSFDKNKDNKGTVATKIFLLQFIRHVFHKDSDLVTLEELGKLSEGANFMFPLSRSNTHATNYLTLPLFFSINAELGSSGVDYELFDAAYVLFLMSIANEEKPKSDINALFPEFLQKNKELVYTLNGIDYSVRNHSVLTHLILARLITDEESFFLPALDMTFFDFAAKWLSEHPQDSLSIFSRSLYIHRFGTEPSSKTQLLNGIFNGYKFTGKDIRSFQTLTTKGNLLVL